MALDARNIIVGASPLFLSKKDSTDVAYAAVLPEGSNVTSGASVLSSTTAGALSNSAMNAAYRNVGYTNNGLQITYNPTYGSVTVDQLLDTAKLFKESMEVMLATEFAEATLENVLAVFGQGGETLSNGELGLAAGALGLQPTERQLIAVGNAPTVNNSGANQKSERVYYARRVLSVQQSQFTLARNAATVFPVTFRLLPDAAYAGKEYGVIVDRVLTA
jgi:hypothetical protein